MTYQGRCGEVGRLWPEPWIRSCLGQIVHKLRWNVSLGLVAYLHCWVPCGKY